MVSRRIIAVAAGLTLICAAGCRLLQSGPTDQEVVAAVEKSPPAPPTAGPTYLSELRSVQIEQRGPYKADGKYWPVLVRLKGGVKIKLTTVFQLGLLGEDAKRPAEPVEFVEEARFTKDNFAKWGVSYSYDPRGPRWRFGRDTSPGDR